MLARIPLLIAAALGGAAAFTPGSALSASRVRHVVRSTGPARVHIGAAADGSSGNDFWEDLKRRGEDLARDLADAADRTADALDEGLDAVLGPRAAPAPGMVPIPIPVDNSPYPPHGYPGNSGSGYGY